MPGKGIDGFLNSDGEEFAANSNYDVTINAFNNSDINYAYQLQEQTPFATLVERAYRKAHKS